jgi:hypothetical protein
VLPTQYQRVAQWPPPRKLNQSLPSMHDDMALLGLTRTTVSSVGSRKNTSISLLNGLSPAGLRRLRPRIYTWLNENIPAERRLKDTIEGSSVTGRLQADGPAQRAAKRSGQPTPAVKSTHSSRRKTRAVHRVVRWI